MKLKYTLITGLFLFASATLVAQDKTQQKNDGPSDADQKAWMDYMTPGPMHQMLASQAGEWHEDLTFWMAPGGPATKAEAEASNSMILGGRYQVSVHKGMMMGMPFEGRSTVGYDNAKKVFQSTWVDNMGSGIMFMEGKYDEATKTLTTKGKGIDPGTGKEENVREVIKFIDDKTHQMEMYMTKDGKEFKNMEIRFTKKS